MTNEDVANGFVIETAFSGEVVEDLTIRASALVLNAENTFVILVAVMFTGNESRSAIRAVYRWHLRWCGCCNWGAMNNETLNSNCNLRGACVVGTVFSVVGYVVGCVAVMKKMQFINRTDLCRRL